ncbi:MAG: hypothetical protein GY697_23470 [Desulfobacterales bacterium]|nr:hypothetical protein [Desulfobacterales bacterium]
MQALANYHWPGNVRELKNYIARGVILSKKKKLCIDDLPDINSTVRQASASSPDHMPSLSLPQRGIKIQDMEKELIRTTLEQCGGNKSQAAQRLGISRKTLYEKIARYDIQ